MSYLVENPDDKISRDKALVLKRCLPFLNLVIHIYLKMQKTFGMFEVLFIEFYLDYK